MIKKVYWIFILLFTLPIIAQQIPQEEYEVLLEMHSALSGHSWKNKWDLTSNNAHQEKWYGVTVKDGHVVELNLESNNLKGELPSSLSRLKKITKLNFNYNLIHGAIPLSFKEFEKIELHLYGNQINEIKGMMPLTNKLDLRNQTIVLDKFEFKGKDVVLDLPEILFYSRTDNSFTANPRFAVRIKKYHNSSISNIAHSYVNEDKQLVISKDLLLGLNNQDEISLYIDTYSNKYADLYTSLVSFAQTIITTPKIPDSEYKALVDLYNSTKGDQWRYKWDVSENNLHLGAWYGLILEDGHVIGLNLNNNNLNGKLPDSFGDLSYLKSFNLYDNYYLTGSLPSSINKMGALTSISLYSCSLSGTLPINLEGLRSLTHLNLSYNQFTAKDIVGLASLPALTHLYLNNNPLAGELSESFFSSIKSKTLVEVNLYNTKLSGQLPDALAEFKALKTLDLRLNSISGFIPESYESFHGLTLNLQSNQISEVKGLMPLDNSVNLRNQSINLGEFVYKGDDVVIQLPKSVFYIRSKNTFEGTPLFQVQKINAAGGVNGLVDLYADKDYKLVIPKKHFSGLLSSDKIRLYINSYQSDFVEFYGSYLSFDKTTINTPKVPDSEYKALVDLYNSTNGSQWRYKWDVSENNLHLGAWYGVEIEDGHVIGLNLNNNILNGKLPDSFGDLSYLKSFNLHDNYYLTGSLPSSINQMEALTSVNLYSCRLSGTLPINLEGLKSLTHLNLSNNQLTAKDIVGLASLPALTHLYLNDNPLAGELSESFFSSIKSKTLVEVTLYNTKLSGQLPDALVEFKALKSLDLRSNSISGAIPESYEGFHGLKLDLQSNQISEVKGLMPLDNTLYLRSQSINLGEFVYTGDDVVIQLPKSVFYIRSKNTFDGVPLFLVQKINAAGGASTLVNNLYADKDYKLVIPKKHFSGLLSSDKIRLYINSYQSDFVEFYGSYLSFDKTTINTPKIPDSEYKALVDLYNSTNGSQWRYKWDVSENNLHLGAWYGVEIEDGHVIGLNLNNNNLNGKLPDSFGDLSYLKSFNLYDNYYLTGSLPSSINKMGALTSVNLYSCRLSGTLPINLDGLKSLTYLNLSYNQFTANDIIGLASLPALTHLYLNDNPLAGELNNSFFSSIKSKTLVEVTLYNTKLSGQLPDALAEFKALKSLDLRSNSISGAIPESYEGFHGLKLDLQSNQISEVKGLMPLDNTLYLRSQSINLEESVYKGGDLKIELPNVLFYERSSNTFNASSIFSVRLKKKSSNNYQEIFIGSAIDGVFTIPQEKLMNLEAGDQLQWFLNNYNSSFPEAYGSVVNTSEIVFDIQPLEESEFNVLVDLYKATDGENWTTSWDISNNNLHLVKWHGVNVHEGKIVELNLTNNNLKGTLPYSIKTLSKLKALVLNKNELTGVIPDVSQMSELITIDFSSNYFRELESAFIYSKNIDVSKQKFILSSEDVSISSENISVKLPEISRFYYGYPRSHFNGLYTFKVTYNDDEIGTYQTDSNGNIHFPLLSLINQPDYNLLKIEQQEAAFIGTSYQLETAGLYPKQLDQTEYEVLKEFYHQHKGQDWIKTWDITSNNLHQKMWHGVSILDGHVVYINLPKNNLTGELGNTLSKLPNLKKIDLRGNKLRGAMPESFGTFSDLKELDLAENQLTKILTSLPYEMVNVRGQKLVIDSMAELIGQHLAVPIYSIHTFNANHRDFNSVNTFWLYVDDRLIGVVDSNSPKISDELLFVIKQGENLPKQGKVIIEQRTGASRDSRIEYNGLNFTRDLPIVNNEFELLLELFNKLDGKQWVNKWDMSKNNLHLVDWFGITHRNGHVVALDLKMNRLAGKIDFDLKGFTELQDLDLSYNSITDLTYSISKDVQFFINNQSIDYGILPLKATESIQVSNLQLYDHNESGFAKEQRFVISIANEKRTIDIPNSGMRLIDLRSEWNIDNHTPIEVKQMTGSAYNSISKYILEFDKGDANMDGSVDVLDLQYLVNRALQYTLPYFNFKAADLNSDKNINVFDAVIFSNDLLPNQFLEEQTPRSSALSVNSRSLDDLTAKVGIKNSTLYLEPTSDEPIAAFDIRLKNVTVDQIKVLLRGYSVYVSKSVNNQVAVVGFTINNNFIEKVTDIISLPKTAQIVAVKLSDSNAQEIKAQIIVHSENGGENEGENEGGNEGEAGNKFDFTYYPNPVLSDLNLIFDIDFPVKAVAIEIYNMESRLVYKNYLNYPFAVSNSTIDLSQLSNGVYIIVADISTEKGVFKKKFKIIKR